jgi:hypothetical protein
MPTAPSSTVSSPAHIRAAITVHSCSIATKSSRESVVTSKTPKVMRSCWAVTIPAWCSP